MKRRISNKMDVILAVTAGFSIIAATISLFIISGDDHSGQLISLIIFDFISVIVEIFAVKESVYYFLCLKKGVYSEGVVEEKYSTKRSKGRRYYYVQFNYLNENNVNFVAKDRISYKEYIRMNIGSRLTLKCYKGHVTIVCID